MADTISNSTKYTVVDGTDNDDIISNTGVSVTINGGAGNDSIYSRGEKSSINSGDGNNTINSSGDDVIINAGSGDDRISSTGDNVTINAGSGDDRVSSTGDNVIINAGDGNDRISNTSSIAGDHLLINAGAGNDSIYTHGDYTTINAGTGDDLVSLGSYIAYNTIEYADGDGNDTIYGLKSNDTIKININSYSTLKSDNDLIVRIGNGSLTLKNAASKRVLIQKGNGAVDTLEGAVYIINKSNNTVLSGNANDDSINSSSGDYVSISGEAGNDTIRSYGKYVSISGGDGDDRIYNSGDYATISAGAGSNYVSNSGERTSISSGDGEDRIYNSGDYATIITGAGSDYVSSTGERARIITGDGNDTIYSSGSNVRIFGGNGDDYIVSDGNASVVTGDGNDSILIEKNSTSTVNAGKGNDTIIADGKVKIIYTEGDGNDVIRGFGPTDTLQITYGDFSTQLSGEDVIINVGSGTTAGSLTLKDAKSVALNIVAGCISINNSTSGVVTATKGNDTITNTAKDVVINAVAGDNIINNSVEASNVVINGAAGKDTIYNAASYVTINGGAGADYIRDTASNVMINGGADNDSILVIQDVTNVTVAGGAGDDTIRDFNSNAKIVVQYADGDGNDVITNFGTDDTLHITSGRLSNSSYSENDLIFKVGGGSITLKNAKSRPITIKNASGEVSKKYYAPADINVNVSDTLVNGSDYDDSINASSSASNVTINAGLGNDTISGFGYNLIQYAEGDGNDVINGSLDRDTIHVTSGKISGSTLVGSDVLLSIGSGTITLKSAKDKVIHTKEGSGKIVSKMFVSGSGSNSTENVIIVGSEDEDRIRNSASKVSISGGAGNDSIYNDSDCSNVTIKAGLGEDTINVSNSSVNLIQYAEGDGNDVIVGFNANDTFHITSGSISRYSSSDDDLILYIGTNSVTFKGKKGDTIKIKDASGNVFSPDFNLILNNSTKSPITLDSIYETADASSRTKAIRIIGNELSNTIQGGKSKDTIRGGAGDDSLLGNAGNDKLYGDAGNDTLIGGKGNDTLTGGAGNDVFVYASGDGKDVITDYTSGQDIIKLTDGTISKVSLSGRDVVLKVGSGSIKVKKGKGKALTIIDSNDISSTVTYTDTLTLTNSNNNSINVTDDLIKTIDASTRTKAINITANSNANTIKGGSKADTIYGGAGNDSILGNTGNDKLYGESGNDTLIGGKGNDTLYGGNGNDVFVYSTGDGNDVIADFTAGETIKLQSGTTLSRISISGNDTVLKIGDDSIKLKDAKNQAFTLVDANKKSTSIIYGSTGNDSLIGTAKADSILGNAGADTIIGGKGNDTLTGGTGANVFIYASGDGNDIITDYKSSDKISITGDSYTRSTVGNDVKLSIGSGSILLKDAKNKTVKVLTNSKNFIEEPWFVDDNNFASSDVNSILRGNDAIYNNALVKAADYDINSALTSNKQTSEAIAYTGKRSSY